MVNLLPKNLERSLVSEYHLRALSLLILFSAVAVIAGAVLLLPSLFILEARVSATKAQVATFGKPAETNGGEEVEMQIRAIRDELRAATAGDTSPVYDLIRIVIGQKPEGVLLDSFFYDTKGTASILTVKGIADSRDDLVAFSRSLLSQSVFADVELPISDLAARTDIEFSMTMKIAEKQ